MFLQRTNLNLISFYALSWFLNTPKSRQSNACNVNQRDSNCIYFRPDNGDGLCHQGVLLYGPPGTGKTLLARAVAHHTECTFIRVSGSELVQKFIGEGSRMVRELFVMARYGQ